MKKRHIQKLILIGLLLLFGLNFPLLLLFNSAGAAFGFPVIYVYVFLVWGLSIVLSFLIFKKYDE